MARKLLGIAAILLSVGIMASHSYAVQLPVWPYNNTDWSQVRVTQDYGCRGLTYLLLGNNPKDDYLQKLTCRYETQSHTGLDFGTPKDANGNALTDDTHLTIKPALAGKVVDYCSYEKEGDVNSSCSHGFGNWIIQNTGNSTCPYAFYAHLQWGSISEEALASYTSGIALKETQTIGIMGESGGVPRHLHFECKTSPVINAPDGKDDAPLAGKINYAYMNDHPSNHGYIDPFTLLTTPTRKLLFVSVPEQTSAEVQVPSTRCSAKQARTKYMWM